MTVDVGIVGGGIIGLAVAWRCAGRGLRVTVHDPDPGTGASRVAAGMLAPVNEAYFGEEALTALLVESARRWPAFAAELTAATGLDVGYRTEGTLAVGLTSDDRAQVDRLREYQQRLGLPVTALTGGQLRQLEPSLASRVRGGAHAPGDRQVDPRRVVGALRAACAGLGVTIVPNAVARLSDVDARTVVVAAGCASAALAGLPVRPVKGEVLRLRATGMAGPPLRHVIRGYADGRPSYLVPRADGELVVGATSDERADLDVTAQGVLDLLRAATELVPAVGEYALVEAIAGHRPGTPDNGPLIGLIGGDRRLVAATGHYRHGVLLTPVTADAVADLVDTGAVPDVVAPFTPDRFPGPA